ncbi:MAG: repeat-containing protein [Ramlibacter sp.]|nr:repeat-containing protein [Ramlibacter sp.]MDB5915245.1 repeat-containing protein [Ramlibacter sp.]
MTHMKHWQDPVNALLGAWLVVSPWVLGFQDVTVATTSTVTIGVLLVAFSLGAISAPQAWEEWGEVRLGVLLMVTPALLGFSAIPAALHNALFTGSLVVVLSLWVLGTDKDYRGWWQRLVG